MSSDPRLSVLIVDDEDSLQKSICLNLEAEGYSCSSIGLGEKALEIIKKQKFDVVICDYRLPDIDGISFIKKCKKLTPETETILITGFGDNELAVKALKSGAYSYITKPFEFDELIFTLRKIEEKGHLVAENTELKSVIHEKFNFENIISQSSLMKDIFETVSRLAKFNTSVLIRGESGTGKELIARAIHHNSPRKGKPFIAINCGAIPENLMESEFFGHVAGAFTDARSEKKGLFEEANGGTIFLDEIGEMPIHLQVKLLRVLQEKQIQKVGSEKTKPTDVRIIAATLRDLEQDVENGRFRDDLYYRLDVVSILIPPLRDRPEDIPILVEHFIKKHSKKLKVKEKNISPEALRTLIQYNWKGNVRELENSIERGLVLSPSETIDVNSLPAVIRASGTNEFGASISILDENNLSIKQHTRSVEQKLIKKALEQTGGNRTHAAKILEISHRALLYKLKEYNMQNVGK